MDDSRDLRNEEFSGAVHSVTSEKVTADPQLQLTAQTDRGIC